MLARLVWLVTPADASALPKNWRALPYPLAQHDRAKLLGQFANLTSLIATESGPDGMGEFAAAVLDAGRWWP
jgi:hypothetical protein